MIMPKFRTALLLSSLCLFQPAFAQNLPGVEIETPTVPGSVQTLFNLAGRAYPNMFVGGSTFRSYQGFTFKYYASSGIYVGVKDGTVYLLGGQFGGQPKPQGSIADVSAALERFLANPPVTNPGTTADFGGFTATKTAADITSKFTSITMEFGSFFGGFTAGAVQKAKLDVLGSEVIGGTSATVLRLTITGSQTSAVVTYDLAVDASGNVVRVDLGGFAYTGVQAQQLGASFLSGFLIPLAASDNAQLKAAINAEIQNPALSSKVTQRTVGGLSLPTFEVKIAVPQSNVTAYLSDFGSFSMLTEFTATFGATTSYIKILDATLR